MLNLTNNNHKRILGNNVCLNKMELNIFLESYHNELLCNKKNFNLDEINNNSFVWSINSLITHYILGFLIISKLDNNTCEIIFFVNERELSNEIFSEALNYISNYLFAYSDFKKIIIEIDSNEKYFINIMSESNFKIIEKNLFGYKKDKYSGFNINQINTGDQSFTEFINFYYKQLEMYKPLIIDINNNLISIVHTQSICEDDINNYCKLLNKRKKILFEVVNNCIIFFENLTNNKIFIYLTGSYSRNSQRIFSDIDLNFMYENNLIDTNIVYEDLIAFIITNVFDINFRDRVHGMGYLDLINNTPLKQTKYFASVFSSGDIVINTCRDICYDIMYENINMPRAKKNITEYISKNNKINEIKEYIYNHEVIFNNYYDDPILKTLNKNDFKIIYDSSFNYNTKLLINCLIKNVEQQKENIKDDLKFIKDFKKIYKTSPSNLIYSMFFLIRRLEMKKNNKIDVELIKIMFEKLELFGFNSDFIKKIKFDYYDYIFKLNKIEYIFKSLNVSLSSHTDKTMMLIENGYKNKYSESIYEAIRISLNELYDDILKILNHLKEGFDEK